jgi:nucleoside-diphosphate-sugar epimerase
MVKHALIVGASSMVGYQLAKLLLFQGDWKVTGLARHKKDYVKKIKGFHVVECDLLAPEAEVKKTLEPLARNVTHVFFMTWIPRPTEEEQIKVNQNLFNTIIDTVANTSSLLEHVYLQTGSKYYAMLIGPKGGMVTPCKEDDPRRGPNFYYGLEDHLIEATTSRNLTWSVARPPCILGFTTDTAMNLGTSLAIYALVMKELGKPLIFPYGDKAFHCFRELCDNRVVARFIFWLIDRNNPQNKNQAFNVTNGDLYRMEQLWQRIANYFGMEVDVTHDPNFNLSRFMNENKEVWNRIVERNGLRKYDINSLGTWDFMEQMLKREWDECMLINKSLKYGWTERLDTLDVLVSFFDELYILNVIPTPVSTEKELREREQQQAALKMKIQAGAVPTGKPEQAAKSVPTRG